MLQRMIDAAPDPARIAQIVDMFPETVSFNAERTGEIISIDVPPPLTLRCILL